MQIQIPIPRAPIQGPTIQPTFPVPPVSQPEMSGYLVLHQNRYMVSPPPYVHQGATILKTFPVPPVSEPELNGYWNLLNYNRYIVPAPPQLHQGATVQQTLPIPPVSQSDPWYLYPQRNRHIVDAVKQLHQGATIQQTFPVPPVSQPESWYLYTYPQLNRYIVNAKTQIDQGATKQQTFPVPPLSQPYFPVSIQQAYPQLISPNTFVPQQTFPVPPVSQPTVNAWDPSQQNRYIVNVIPQLHQGATIQQTFPVFKTVQPELAYLTLQQNRYIVDLIKRFEGATVQQTFPIPPVSQPTTDAWDNFLQQNRYIVDTVKRFEGATNQQTFPVFKTAQPELSYLTLDRNRYIVDATKRFDGPTIQPTFPISPLSQPIFIPVVQQVSPNFISPNQPVLPFTNIFTTAQPELSYLSLQQLRYIVGVIPPLWYNPPPTTTQPVLKGFVLMGGQVIGAVMTTGPNGTLVFNPVIGLPTV